MNKKYVVFIDYGSFDRNTEYKDSLNELTDTLTKKHINTYALLPVDSKKQNPTIDVNTEGVIYYSNDMLMKFSKELTERTEDEIDCYSSRGIFVISSNPLIISRYETAGFTVCRINNGHNDLVESKGFEINHIKQINNLIK